MQHITSAEVYADMSQIINPAKITLKGRTKLTKHRSEATRSTNSQIFLSFLKIFSLSMPTLDTKLVRRKKLTLA